MSKISFLTPSEEITELIKKALINICKTEDEVIIETLQFEDIIGQGKKLVAAGVQVIITGGGTYSELCKSIDKIPIINLTVSTNDILYALSKIKDKYKSIYLLLNERILFDQEKCLDMIDKKIFLFRYRGRNDLSALLTKIKIDNESVIVGSGLLAQLADGMMNTVPIIPSTSTILSMYQHARDLAELNIRDNYRLSVLEAILSNIEDGIIFINNSQKIVHANKKAADYLNFSLENIPSLTTLFPDLDTQKMIFPTEAHLIQQGKYTLVARISHFTAYKAKEYIIIVQDVSKIQALEKNVRMKLTQKGLTATYNFDDILTQNKRMMEIIDTAKVIAAHDFPVLIQGQSGTGKELFAQSIHNASERCTGPFIAVNCAALPESILESELFGYVNGAFTGTRKEGKAGLFELAHQGTIFLDEINSMSLQLQSKLLRVLDTKEVMRLGSDYIIPLNIRVLSASNSNLSSDVKNGCFRKDLFFRLNAFTLDLPDLNGRKEDILFLFKKFVAKKQNKPIEKIKLTHELENALLNHNWGGNVRELAGTVEKYLIWRDEDHYKYLFSGTTIAPFPEEKNLITDDLQINLKELNGVVDSIIIQSLLNKGLSKIQVAKLLGISRQTLFNKTKSTKFF